MHEIHDGNETHTNPPLATTRYNIEEIIHRLHKFNHENSQPYNYSWKKIEGFELNFQIQPVI